MKYSFYIFLLSGSSLAMGIDSTKIIAGVDSLKRGSMNVWIPTVVTGLNVSQIAFSNWAQGGSNAFTWNGTGSLGLGYRTGDWTFRNRCKLAYGRTRLAGQGYITNDNDLYLESVLSYDIGWGTDPYLSNSVVTTVAEGYSYKTNSPTPTANFFDPGYVTQSLGFTYNKLQSFVARLGVATQEVFTNKYRQYTDNPATPNVVEAFKFETGLESATQEKVSLAENINLSTGLRLFTRFESLDIWDIRWDNVITANVNSLINVNFNYQLIYQKDQSLATQTKEGLQVGMTYTIL
jgi:Protein of unknown function (DUF3078)